MQTLKESLKTIALSLIALSLIGVAYAWTEPNQNPPNPAGGSTPVNTSSTAQIKAGNLQVNALVTSATSGSALIVPSGNVGIGTTSPNYELDVSGGASWNGAKIGVGQSTQAEGNNLTNSGTYNAGRSYFRSTWDDNFRISTYDSTPNGNWEIGIGDGTGGISAGKYIMMTNAGYLGVGTNNPSYKLDVNGQVKSSDGFVFPDGTTQTTAAGGSGGNIISSSIVGTFSGSYIYTIPSGTSPISLTVAISTYGGGNREGSVDVRWVDSAGGVVRDWTRISGTNIGNGNDGGSGMRDKELATIPFLNDSTRIEFKNGGANGYTGELIAYTYQ